MQNSQNSLNNNVLSGLIRQAGPRVLGAIKRASAATGADFAYLLQKASSESNFNSSAKSHSSSATGLYQFIDKTWLGLVKKYGAKCGMGQYANCIDGNGHVADPAVKRQILALRKNPDAAAMMAAEFATENKSYMQAQLGPHAKIGATELNLAHFLGPGGATAFMRAYQDNPLAQASDMFPKAANVNRGVFYDSKTGAPRTLAGVYDLFGGRTTSSGAPSRQPAPVSAAANASETAATGTAQALLARTLADNVASEAAALQSGGGDGTDKVSARSETIHWFTPRHIPIIAAASTGAAPSLPGSLLADPAQVMMMARTHVRPARSTDYDRLNS
jgi:hypothetical protein